MLFVVVGVFGFVKYSYATEMCCVYFEENIAGADQCYDFATGQPVGQPIDPDSASCPGGTYSGRLIGAYGFGPSPLATEPNSRSYRDSDISKSCINLSMNLDGIDQNLEVRQIDDYTDLCEKGLTLMSTPKGLQLRTSLVQKQFEDMERTLRTITDDDSVCCVPRIKSESGGGCNSLSLNQKEFEEKYSLFTSQTTPGLNSFYFPSDDKLTSFMTCDASISKKDWELYSDLNISNPIPGGVTYLLYPEKCDTVTGNNYLPPWGYGNNSQPPQQLGAMCDANYTPQPEYCACTLDKSDCGVTTVKTKYECEEFLRSSSQTDKRVCTVLESGWDSCESLVTPQPGYCACTLDKSNCGITKLNTKSQCESVLNEVSKNNPNLSSRICVSVEPGAECSSLQSNFCICTNDKSSCIEQKYINKPDCEKAIGSFGDSKSVQCLVVEKGKECSTLVEDSQNNNGQTNSDMLSGLSSDIKALNKLNVNNVQSLLGNFIKLLLGILGTLALVMIMYGGFLFMTANGNADNKKKAVGIFVWSTLGIVIIFSSYAVVNFVLDILK
ncbi:MAG: hypothetical protein A2507_01895 [Candidatus Magasanikbacteria bacterium RIFOXYD12_FULL_33_17]|nr:MAG: hypothetical protein A2507_01895 [Candidatus Magasanikbacteria bacterium RIFOXYD12_FULL_33_17]